MSSPVHPKTWLAIATSARTLFSDAKKRAHEWKRSGLGRMNYTDKVEMRNAVLMHMHADTLSVFTPAVQATDVMVEGELFDV